MTTIAYKDGVIAADTQMTWGRVRRSTPNKIHTLPTGLVLAGAGDQGSILEMIRFYSKPDWQKNLDDIPEVKRFEAFLVIPEGWVYYLEDDALPDPLYDDYAAIGSGWQFALAGLRCGLSPRDAVVLASEFDIYTNDKVTLYEAPRQAKKRSAKGRAASRVPSQETGRGGTVA